MKYITSRELAEKWNISQRRIVRLASEGKIEGAQLYGKSWMFPESAIKPEDGRTKSGKAMKHEKDDFRYPLFEFKDTLAFNPPLTEEELRIKKCIEAFNAFRFYDAAEILGNLPLKTHNRYIRLTALYCGCMLSIFLFDTSLFLDYYGELKSELANDFPHKAEMIEYIHEIDSVLGEDEYYSSEFNNRPAYYYHESFLPRLCSLSALRVAFGNKQLTLANLAPHEINCSFLEKTDNPFDLQAVHVCLACAYSILDKSEECNYHFSHALKLAEKYDMFYNIAVMQYYYTKESLDVALAGFPEDFKRRVIKHNRDFRESYVRFVNTLKLNTLYKFLSGNEYIYIMLAVQGLSNKEIADRLHVSVGAVGKHYSKIYAEYGIKNKAEMIELYHSLTHKTVKISPK